MHLAADYIHPTPHKGRCRVRIYLPDEERDAVVVICTELANNPGASITNAVRRIAAEVIEAHHLPTPLVWIEHHPPGTTNGRTESFEMVVFDSYEIRERRASYMGATGRWRSEALPGKPWTGSVWICWWGRQART